MREIIMGYQGEMSLKGLNRNQFESAMMKILRYRLKTVGKFKVYCTQSTFYMEPEEEDVDMDLAFDRVRTVFGLAALSRAVVCEKDFDTICRTAEEYLGDSLHGIKTFKVEARRSDKTYPMTSPELMRELGAYLLGLHNYLRVDVKNPQFKVIVEIRDYGAYIHGPKIPGEGGLPVGTSGRALNMLSGGIDSPVAAYRMAKRGLALDHIHFASPPYTSERAKLKVKALAQKITPYTGSSNLFVVPYTKPQEYIRDNAPDVLFTVLMRRSMMRIANRIATRQGCEALITGEADAITKAPGDELLSGAFVVSGRCRARLDRVGAESYAARLTLEAKKDVTVGKSEMMSSLDKLIRIIGILLIPIGVALFVKEFVFLERTAQEAVVSMVAALIGMIPEGLYLLTSVALAVSMIRLAQGKVLAQDMNCIETLARVDVLCVDKTGTITEPHMEVGEVVYLDEEKYAETVVTETLNAFYQSMEADNDTARAMAQKFHGKSLWHAAQTIPFTSATKWSAAVFPGHGAFVVGAPEFIMGNRYADLKEAVDPWSEKGYRVLLVAEYGGVPDQKGLDPRRVSPMALVALSNRIRPAAPKTFRYFAEQGVA